MDSDERIALEYAIECIQEDVEYIENDTDNLIKLIELTNYNPEEAVESDLNKLRCKRLDWIKRLYWIYLIENKITQSFSSNWWEENDEENWHRRNELLKFLEDKDREPIEIQVEPNSRRDYYNSAKITHYQPQ